MAHSKPMTNDDFYSEGYEQGCESDGSHDFIAWLSFDDFRHEMAEEGWAKRLPRVAEGDPEEGLLDISSKDYRAFLAGFDAGMKEEKDTPELPPWEYGLCTG